VESPEIASGPKVCKTLILLLYYDPIFVLENGLFNTVSPILCLDKRPADLSRFIFPILNLSLLRANPIQALNPDIFNKGAFSPTESFMSFYDSHSDMRNYKFYNILSFQSPPHQFLIGIIDRLLSRGFFPVNFYIKT